jgi:hypothetical protein
VESEYKEVMKLYDAAAFHKDSKYNLKEIVEDESQFETESSYLCLLMEDFDFESPLLLSNWINELEKTHSKFLFQSCNKPLNAQIAIKDDLIYALSAEQTIKQPNLMEKNRFVVIKKEILKEADGLDLFKNNYLKQLLISEKNLAEPTLIYLDPKGS